MYVCEYGELIHGWVYIRVGLYSGGFIFGWVYIRNAVSVSNMVGLSAGSMSLTGDRSGIFDYNFVTIFSWSKLKTESSHAQLINPYLLASRPVRAIV